MEQPTTTQGSDRFVSSSSSLLLVAMHVGHTVPMCIAHHVCRVVGGHADVWVAGQMCWLTAPVCHPRHAGGSMGDCADVRVVHGCADVGHEQEHMVQVYPLCCMWGRMGSYAVPMRMWGVGC